MGEPRTTPPLVENGQGGQRSVKSTRAFPLLDFLHVEYDGFDFGPGRHGKKAELEAGWTLRGAPLS